MNELELFGKDIDVKVNDNFSLTVLRNDGCLLWESSQIHIPTILLRAEDTKTRRQPLSSAEKASVSDFDDGKHRGQTVRLSGFDGIDIALELTFAIDAAVDEILIQVAQVDGKDTVESVCHLYRFEKPVTDGGYMVLPHGSGYLIPAECPDELPGKGIRGGLIGGRWSMPMFGMVREEDAMCVIVETWWDCDVEAEHLPEDLSSLDFNWLGSLGKLAYPRRFILRFAQGMDYVAMAKLYRGYARKQGLLRTLEEKASETPVIRQYIENILLRWAAWNSEDGPTVLNDIRRLQKMGFGINFFFPKWSSSGYSPERGTATTADANWQAYLLSNPVPGGWEALVEFANAIHRLGCTIQGFVNPRSQDAAAPEFDASRWPQNTEEQPIHDLSSHDALERTKRVLDNIEAKGLKYDVLYYDGYSAHYPLPEDYSRLHPQTRRQTYEVQNACFAETRRRGIMPGAELARFWCMADCDYFFFTDWSSDRLSNTPVQGAPAPVGEPIPLFQLVFHDCYIAGFSGGGYALYSPGYDWWEDCTPRLYELLFASAPAHNWLSEGYVPIRDWDSEKARRHWTWLKRWNSYYRTTATSEMISHRFLSSDRKQQRIEFANGVIAEFNMTTDELRVKGVAGFSGEWEKPEA
ncbi:TPA: hypothetical protein EYP66_24620 [Candidatus Poribacteria bacterium]|nr:hypothetical protein [Candidatus Poribacteria bacterium]